jgi:methyl-accepting chemotaxis protein-1 (serine sensor receptor)
MDEMTQQNAALVEQAAAAAESMEEQAYALEAAVSVFKLSKVLRHNGNSKSKNQAQSASVSQRAIALKTQPTGNMKVGMQKNKIVSSDSANDWEEF